MNCSRYSPKVTRAPCGFLESSSRDSRWFVVNCSLYSLKIDLSAHALSEILKQRLAKVRHELCAVLAQNDLSALARSSILKQKLAMVRHELLAVLAQSDLSALALS